jgi:hypothetical protein
MHPSSLRHIATLGVLITFGLAVAFIPAHFGDSPSKDEAFAFPAATLLASRSAAMAEPEARVVATLALRLYGHEALQQLHALSSTPLRPLENLNIHVRHRSIGADAQDAKGAYDITFTTKTLGPRIRCLTTLNLDDPRNATTLACGYLK